MIYAEGDLQHWKSVFQETSPFWGPFIKIALIAVIGGLVSILLLIYLYEYLYYRLYFYSFGEDRGEVKKGVFSLATGHVRYDRLQNVYVDQDFLDRIFGLYDVHYETAGETSGFYSHVDGLNKVNADKLVSFLNGKAEKPTKAKETINQEIAKQEVKMQETKKEENSKEVGKANISRENCPISYAVVKKNTAIMVIFSLFTFIILGLTILPSLFSYSAPSVSDFLFPIILIFAMVVLTVAANIYYRVWYKNFDYKFGATKGEIFTQVIGQSSSFLYYNRIQNVSVQQNVIDRLFNIFTLSIETAGEASGRALKIEGLEKEGAERIKDFLLDKSEKYHSGL
jgi:putative membrane protein